jgi:hypothetical protein
MIGPPTAIATKDDLGTEIRRSGFGGFAARSRAALLGKSMSLTLRVVAGLSLAARRFGRAERRAVCPCDRPPRTRAFARSRARCRALVTPSGAGAASGRRPATPRSSEELPRENQCKHQC